MYLSIVVCNCNTVHYAMIVRTFNSIPHNKEWIWIVKSQSRNRIPQNSEKVTFVFEVLHCLIPCPSCDRDWVQHFEALSWKPELTMINLLSQSRTSKCCSIGEQGFDPRKCYSLRVRLRRLVPHCNVVTYSSDWAAETFWMNGTLLGNSKYI